MSSIMDFHSHILPGIDDGSKSLEESLSMLRMEAEQGIRHVVATPHFYPQHDRPERFLERRTKALLRLQEAIGDDPAFPSLSAGSEVYYFNGISESDVISELTIDKKRCILIEMPPAPWTDSMFRELEEIYIRRGLVPIVAHVDRYITRFRTFRIPQRLAELPVLVQANAEFFLERATSSMALRMLKEGKIHLLGSDCHNLNSRKPNLGPALELIRKRLGEDIFRQIAECQQDVLCGE